MTQTTASRSLPQYSPRGTQRQESNLDPRLPSYDPQNDTEEEEELPRYEQPPQRNPDGSLVLQPGDFGEHTEAQSAAFAGDEMYEENQYGEIVHCDSPAARRWGDGRADGVVREQNGGGNIATKFKDEASSSRLQSQEQDYRKIVRAYKYEQLQDSLRRDRPNPYRAWANYDEYCTYMGPETLSLEDHKAALRKCVPPTKELRKIALKRLESGIIPKVPHMYEGRLQTIIGNIRKGGYTLDIDDYDFILDQFAVTGHLQGSRAVFQEILLVGLEPTHKTYGLCLQAAAHRLTLPCPDPLRPELVREAATFCTLLMKDMWDKQIPCTSVNLDLAIRILKESSSPSAFESLLKIGYGIDPAYPDRPPIHYREKKWDVLGPSSDSLPSMVPNDFTTSALNTTIDFYGRHRLLSRMVAVFETLSTPLPQPSQSSPAFLDEDEEDSSGFTRTSPSPHSPSLPHAVPNTTTYNFIIKHSAKAGSVSLARHYILEAFAVDRQNQEKLSAQITNLPLAKVESPRFAVNRGTLLPIFGLSNRSKHLPLARWVSKYCQLALDRKKASLVFFRAIASEVRRQEILNDGISSPDTSSEETVPDALEEESADSTAEDIPTVRAERREIDPLDLDVTSTSPPPPRPWKSLNLDLHISILERDIKEIGELSARAKDSMLRIAQRIKERLGRRVWAGKDIYLVSEGKRVHVTKDHWRNIVRYRVPRPHQVYRPNKRSRPGSQDDGSMIGGHDGGVPGRQWRSSVPHFTPSFTPTSIQPRPAPREGSDQT
ncbi:hypothetical protein SISSUDRAFT_1062646 [Sistotremastrum suecicum HHB10207 ss-3]|uniref:Uncharacterized protein n=1 Tax=Sistotremastrum suecicum HHB10207 ss-3 TaxID=1314776 RepID=A0A166CMJ0_9AGAM|nr:hypothetical protein SISSUDRAFT_1062646 [Sistotremastrum suecicum HHB10207 ss-3]